MDRGGAFELHTLALGPLQPLAFAQAGNVEHLAGRCFDRLYDIIVPRQAPAGFRQRIDPRHAFPAAVAVAQAA